MLEVRQFVPQLTGLRNHHFNDKNSKGKSMETAEEIIHGLLDWFDTVKGQSFCECPHEPENSDARLRGCVICKARAFLASKHVEQLPKINRCPVCESEIDSQAEWCGKCSHFGPSTEEMQEAPI